MRKRAIITVVVIFIMFVNENLSLADNGWELSIKANVLNAENRLIIGQRADASDGIDGRYDVPALLAGDIKAYMEIDGNKYWKSIKESCNTPCRKTWNIFIDSEPLGQTIEFSWNSLDIPDNELSIILTDTATGKVVDMKTEYQYSCENTGKKEFVVEVQKR